MRAARLVEHAVGDRSLPARKRHGSTHPNAVGGETGRSEIVDQRERAGRGFDEGVLRRPPVCEQGSQESAGVLPCRPLETGEAVRGERADDEVRRVVRRRAEPVRGERLVARVDRDIARRRVRPTVLVAGRRGGDARGSLLAGGLRTASTPGVGEAHRLTFPLRAFGRRRRRSRLILVASATRATGLHEQKGNHEKRGDRTTDWWTHLGAYYRLAAMRVKDHVRWHLDHDYTRPIRDPLWGHIYLSDGLVSIVNSVEFQQLSRIKQLGPTHLVYPGATHTRLAHSLGVYHIAYRMIRALLVYDEAPAIDGELVSAYLAAALLHDLGHFPFTHSLKELPLADHEALAAEIVREGDLARRIREDLRTDPDLVARIIDESLDDAGRPEVRLFRRLLSGSLDPDKLDYLNRDAYFCGVPYGTQDIDFALSRLRPNGADGIALERSGISAVENILFSKYLMYRAVYWHRTVRVATAMIKVGLYHGLTEGFIDERDLYGLNDETFYAGFCSHEERPFDLIRRVYDRQLYVPAADLGFDETNPAHARLANLEDRAAVEKRLHRLISRRLGREIDPLDIIVDIPEAESFEVSFPVIDGDRIIDYPDAGSVFTPHVIEDFTRTLRRIRMILEPGVAADLDAHRQLLDEAVESP